MQNRLVMRRQLPEIYRHLVEMDRFLAASDIDPLLFELVKIRASQINGCAYCLDMHTKDALKKGETDRRIFALNAWRESRWFTPAEKATLALTEEMTQISDYHVSDEVYEEMSEHFDEAMIAKLMMLIVLINSWNRIAISTNMLPAD